MKKSAPYAPPARRQRWTGAGQLTLVEHSLCPLDPAASLVENLIHDSSYFFVDQNRQVCQARARIISPSGLSASDEFYLWGLLALTFAQPEADANLYATPHYCLRQLGVIDPQTRRGGYQYQQFAGAIERLSQVTYLNDRFYDPVRAEHRKVSFGFLSFSLPLDPKSHRAWRIVWDPIFFDVVRAAGGSFHFDLATYRDLDFASRRLFLLLSKIFSRRSTSPRFELRHLAVNVLGFASTVATRDLKVKVRRCIERLIPLGVVRESSMDTMFVKAVRGEYFVVLERGDYFAKRQAAPIAAPAIDAAIYDQFRSLGFDDQGIHRLFRQFKMPVLREWTDITLAAKERFGASFFKKSPQAFLIDNLKHASRGTRTPPDWWHEVRRAESRKQAPETARTGFATSEPTVSEESREAFERISKEMFTVFLAGGQPEAVARTNAQSFAKECLQRGGSNVHLSLVNGLAKVR